MSFRGVYSLGNHVKDGYIVRRPDIGALIERDDSSVPSSRRTQTTGNHEMESGSRRLNHTASEPMGQSVEGGQRSSLSPENKHLNLGSRVLRRLFGERAEVHHENALPRTQPQSSIHSSPFSIDPRMTAEGRASIRTRTERDRRTRDPVVAPSNDEPGRLPPPYSRGPALPSYDIVIEEEWRRIRSLRRRTLDHASNTATTWCRPGLPSAFFDGQRGGRQRREWSRLDAHE